MYLLDTNVVSELRKVKPHGAVVAWLQSVPESTLHISAVTLGEIQRGIELTREQNPEKAEQLHAWADRLMASQRVLSMDAQVFRVWAQFMHKRSNALFEDAMIAATAQVHQLVVVTRNTQDFAIFGVPQLDPFKTTY